MGQDPLFSLFVHFSTDISEFMKEYFRGFELALHSPWDRAPKGSSAEEMKTAASEVTIRDDSWHFFGIHYQMETLTSEPSIT